jgi:DNA-binding LytR/AlgR family response regulator
LSIVAEMADGRATEEMLLAHQPDLFFLDIHMPGVNGLEAARAIAGRAHVVFVTAFDQYAVEAFERGAIDYVLKPFNEQRLAVTVERLKERMKEPPGGIEALVESLVGRIAPAGNSHLKWIKAAVGNNVRLIPVETIAYFQSDEKYTRVVTCDGEALIRKPIKELLEELDPARFWQVHRATIVNVDAIAGVKRGLKDQGELSLKDRRETLVVSRAFTHLFKQM